MSHTRRSILRGLGTVAAVGSVAGCTNDDAAAEDDGDTPTSTPTATPQASEVTLVSSAFEPNLLVVSAGTTVEFVGESGSHTVTAYHADNGRQHRVPDGTEAFDFPIEAGERGTVTFETEGVYDYHCKPHESVGMVGSVLVGDADADANGLAEPDESDLPEAAAEAIRDLNDRAREELGLEAEQDGVTETGTETATTTETDDSGGGGSGYYRY